MTPLVPDLATYKSLASAGIAEALVYFRHYPIESPQVGHYRIAHKLIFDFIHPWAGRLRAPGEEVSIAGFPGCISGSLPFDSAVHDAQCHEIFEGASTISDKLLLAAFTHARVTRMHPFIDGNGRSSRVVCDALLREIVGRKERLREWGGDYKADLFYAQETDDLGPLMRSLASRSNTLEAVAPKGKVPAPFTLVPGFYTKTEVSQGVISALAGTRGHQTNAVARSSVKTF